MCDCSLMMQNCIVCISWVTSMEIALYDDCCLSVSPCSMSNDKQLAADLLVFVSLLDGQVNIHQGCV